MHGVGGHWKAVGMRSILSPLVECIFFFTSAINMAAVVAQRCSTQ